MGVRPTVEGVDLIGGQGDEGAAVVGQFHLSPERGDEPVVVGEGGEVGLVQVHGGGAQPPEEVPVRIEGPLGGDGDLGGGPAGPLTDLVVCLGEVSAMGCHGDSFLNEDAPAAVHAAGASRR